MQTFSLRAGSHLGLCASGETARITCFARRLARDSRGHVWWQCGEPARRLGNFQFHSLRLHLRLRYTVYTRGIYRPLVHTYLCLRLRLSVASHVWTSLKWRLPSSSVLSQVVFRFLKCPATASPNMECKHFPMLWDGKWARGECWSALSNPVCSRPS